MIFLVLVIVKLTKVTLLHICICMMLQNDALQRELDDLRNDKEERERELRDENAELQGNVAKMRAELEAIEKELQDLLDTKLGLELEIAAYRKLLEGEESRSLTDSTLTVIPVV